MNYIDALAVLKEGTDILEQLQCKWWLSAGTALGAYRDNFDRNFVERDTDLDVGVLNYNDPEKYDALYTSIKNKYLSAGFTEIRTYRGNGYWTQLALAKNEIIFDIYFFYKVTNNTIASFTEHGVMYKPYELINKLDKIQIADNSYFIPTPIEQYLVVRYGKDWKTPSSAKISWEQECANVDGRKATVTEFKMGGLERNPA